MTPISDEKLKDIRIETRHGCLYYKGSKGRGKLSFIDLPEADSVANTYGFQFAENLVSALERIQGKSSIEAGHTE